MGLFESLYIFLVTKYMLKNANWLSYCLDMNIKYHFFLVTLFTLLRIILNI